VALNFGLHAACFKASMFNEAPNVFDFTGPRLDFCLPSFEVLRPSSFVLCFLLTQLGLIWLPLRRCCINNSCVVFQSRFACSKIFVARCPCQCCHFLLIVDSVDFCIISVWPDSLRIVPNSTMAQEKSICWGGKSNPEETESIISCRNGRKSGSR